MDAQQLKALTDKGLDIDYLNRITSLLFLLSTVQETYLLDVEEHIKTHGLKVAYSKDIYTIKNNLKFFKEKIQQQVNGEKIFDLFDDYESLIDMINKWSKIETTK